MRHISITLPKRKRQFKAVLLDAEAPRTCELVWRALPQGGDIYHAKYASNEIYTLVPIFAEGQAGPENRTIVPAAGDVMYFHLPPWTRLPPQAGQPLSAENGVIDLAVFYDRNNLLLSPAEGFTPGNVFARIVGDYDALKSAGISVWREGSVGERMIFERADDDR